MAWQRWKDFEKSNDTYRKLKRGYKRLIGKELRYRLASKGNVALSGDWAVDVDLLNATISPIVYSFGVGDDISFDIFLADTFSAEVHTFDPTVSQQFFIDTKTQKGSITHYQWGVAGKDGTLRLYERQRSDGSRTGMYTLDATSFENTEYIDIDCKSVASIVSELKHSEISIAKFDIEGAEFEAVVAMLEARIYPKQVLIEFHHRLKAYSISDTKRVVEALTNAGYEPFYVSATGREVSFRLSRGR